MLEAEGVDKAHVIALSYGGFVALKLVPMRSVSSLTLIGVGGVDWQGGDIRDLEDRFGVKTLED